MSSIVLELQRDACESKMSVSELLRKALVIAKKLHINEFEEWIKSELNGYSTEKPIDEIPEYRQIDGRIMANNPYKGWQPVIISKPAVYEKLTKRKIVQPLPQLEELTKESDGELFISFSPEIEMKIMQSIQCELPVTLMIDRTRIVSIIQTIRNIILEWALKLEGDGIMGEDISFSNEEKQKAEEKNYTNNFYGDIIQSPIQQSSHSTQTTLYETIDINKVTQLLEEIKNNIDQIHELTGVQKENINTNLRTIEAQINTKKPIKNVIFESLSTIRNILEGAAGSIIASGLLYKLHLFLN